jgi:hypothetical protein
MEKWIMKATIKAALILIIAFHFVPMHISATFLDDMNVTGTFDSTYWKNDPDDWEPGMDVYEGPYTSFENQLKLFLGWRNWYSEVRLRNMKYTDGIHYDYRSREYEADLELFKYKLGYRGQNFEIVAGDFYQFLGRGIALYVQEDPDLNIDRTIRGGHVRFNYNRFEAQVFGGKIRWYDYLDDISSMTYIERKLTDELFGAGLGFRLHDSVRMGLNYVTGTLYAYRRDTIRDEDFQTGSINIEAFGLAGGLLDLYTEYAQLKWNSDAPFGSPTEDGTAIYASLISYLGNFTVLAEYKNYDYWNYRYGRPPTADREDEMTELDDTKGARVKVDYYIPSTGTLVYISASRFNNQGHPDYSGAVTRNESTHFYGGIEQNWSNVHAHLTYGTKEYENINEKHRRATASLVYSFMPRHSLNMHYEYKYTGVLGFDKTEHKTYLTYAFSPYVSLTAHYNVHLFDTPTSTSTSSDTWWAGEIMLTPIDTLTINVLYGGLPTGLICSGGHCRILPEFEGLQATLTYRF